MTKYASFWESYTGISPPDFKEGDENSCNLIRFEGKCPYNTISRYSEVFKRTCTGRCRGRLPYVCITNPCPELSLIDEYYRCSLGELTPDQKKYFEKTTEIFGSYSRDDELIITEDVPDTGHGVFGAKMYGIEPYFSERVAGFNIRGQTESTGAIYHCALHSREELGLPASSKRTGLSDLEIETLANHEELLGYFDIRKSETSNKYIQYMMACQEQAQKAREVLPSISESQETTPDESKGRWVHYEEAMRIRGVERKTLESYRLKGMTAQDGLSGTDSEGFHWRRKAKKGKYATTEYFIPSELENV